MQKEETSRRDRRASLSFFVLINLLLFLVIILPSDFLDYIPSFCIWKRLGLPFCPGCGISRALWHMIHGEIKTAFNFNWRVVIVAPMLAGFYLKLGYEVITGKNFEPGFLNKKFFNPFL